MQKSSFWQQTSHQVIYLTLYFECRHKTNFYHLLGSKGYHLEEPLYCDYALSDHHYINCRVILVESWEVEVVLSHYCCTFQVSLPSTLRHCRTMLLSWSSSVIIQNSNQFSTMYITIASHISLDICSVLLCNDYVYCVMILAQKFRNLKLDFRYLTNKHLWAKIKSIFYLVKKKSEIDFKVFA